MIWQRKRVARSRAALRKQEAAIRKSLPAAGIPRRKLEVDIRKGKQEAATNFLPLLYEA
jgi:hypothetical protein